MKITIPLGSEINKVDNNVIKIRVPNTKFWVLGEKQTDNTWNTYLVDPQTNYKETIKKKYSTKAFAIYSSVILKTPFPYQGKKAENSKKIKHFINKITKNKLNANTRKQSSNLQTNRKRRIKNGTNQSTSKQGRIIRNRTKRN